MTAEIVMDDTTLDPHVFDPRWIGETAMVREMHRRAALGVLPTAADFTTLTSFAVYVLNDALNLIERHGESGEWPFDDAHDEWWQTLSAAWQAVIGVALPHDAEYSPAAKLVVLGNPTTSTSASDIARGWRGAVRVAACAAPTSNTVTLRTSYATLVETADERSERIEREQREMVAFIERNKGVDRATWRRMFCDYQLEQWGGCGCRTHNPAVGPPNCVECGLPVDEDFRLVDINSVPNFCSELCWAAWGIDRDEDGQPMQYERAA